ncbi:MAG: dinitrogenase iron-molybdenum cofactor biosynthesis protein [Actinobacteria bacterium HGW-Actinobacteria-10]|jgi:predicted Fe-Mo cluster-binding NifX family protein|nr:MAG: dinitrogenase iron-molybdenum cofactor biosynthesis protein [Actinobacteria bacterium HGW-Actinobacteria-10]
MKVGVSALGPTIDDRVDERFGRAAYLLVVDESSLEVETLDNAVNRNALQGAGIGAAEAVATRGVQAVITGHLGPKAYKALQAAGIEGFEGTRMTVRDAVIAFTARTLASLGEGEAHTGME